ncbi:cytochrome c oxidase subunit 3 [Rhabdothermincola sp.]|uniref:cytochrome c oxidase subunit 3 n=1 Tax=Rhabdothermincola sp. TaxID=2820405 RepID=UPI002FDF44EC
MTGVATVDRPDDVPSPLGVGVVIWLASEVMFFAGLFAAYFALLAHNAPDWPPADVHLDLLRAAVFTSVLVASSFTIHAAVVASERGQRQAALWYLVATIVLGGLFLTNQVLEYRVLGFGIDSHAYGTIFYLLTGFHGLHVLGGLVALVLVGWVVFSRYSRVPSTQTLRVTSYYWHFVDVVWVVLFAVVFVIR